MALSDGFHHFGEFARNLHHRAAIEPYLLRSLMPSAIKPLATLVCPRRFQASARDGSCAIARLNTTIASSSRL
jgi:hypothetical protein